MKKIILLTMSALMCASTFGQAKKPTIMVVPSDRYCVERGCSITYNDNGTETTLPDYKKTMQNDSDIRLVISKMSGIMSDRNFPLKDLEQELRNASQESAETKLISGADGGSIAESPIDVLKRTAKADIILDLDVTVNKRGPKKYVTFILNAIDAYTGKNIASSSGAGRPSSSAAPDLLLEEAVLSHMDEFIGRLQNHFDDMFANGREVKVMIKMFNSADMTFSETFPTEDGDIELGDIIEDWMADNCVSGRFSLSDASDNFQKYEQVRIPMMYKRNGRDRAMDTKTFVTNLKKHLAEAPYLIDSKVYVRGLGEAWLIIGEN
ncbi:MAG: DUF6175 family protein [Salinivirgaceae bacterium]|nr:DUF6175 family protein [Salinivirgaceae bacterium]